MQRHTSLSAYTNLLYIDMQWAFNVSWREAGFKRQRRMCKVRLGEVRAQGHPCQVLRGTEARRCCGRKHSPCHGLHDSVVEAWIIRAMLWVSGITRLVHMLNIQWDILGRRVWEQAKGQLCWRTCHVLTKICACVRHHRAGGNLCVSVLACSVLWLLRGYLLIRVLGQVWPL